MRAINHSLTGALIGLTVAEPLIAAPLAVVSHFAMDAIPHFGFGPPKSSRLRVTNMYFIALLFVDAILCTALVILLAISKPSHWLLAIICAFLAAAPDFLSFNYFYSSIKGLPWKPSWFIKFATKIQWFERPIGIIVETVWAVCIIFCLSILIRH